MSRKPTIYLDNAATTWPKPEQVPDEITRFYREIGVAAHRGGSSKSAEVDRTINLCRNELAQLINSEPDKTIFCFNGTDGLNLAIHGLVRNGNNVVTTAIEHNSVLRPLHAKQKSDHVELSIVDCKEGIVDLEQLASKISDETDCCCVSQVSNVTGLIQPIPEIARICKSHNVLLIVDACQSVGHISIDFHELGADVLVASGHKGLFGPLGTGFLALSESAAEKIQPIRLGGTGTKSESIQQPAEYPARLESGNSNVGGIFGLLAGIRFVKERGIDSIATHEHRLKTKLVERLVSNKQVNLIGCDRQFESSTAIVSCNVVDQDPQTVAAMLDSAFGIQVRAGLHCAPLMHKQLGTDSLGGTLRISPGAFNTEEDIIAFGDAIEQIAM